VVNDLTLAEEPTHPMLGHKAMLTAARTLAATAVELAVSPDVVAAARAEFEERMGGRPYVSPIPADQKPPVPGS